jgi:hypothetical protein
LIYLQNYEMKLIDFLGNRDDFLFLFNETIRNPAMPNFFINRDTSVSTLSYNFIFYIKGDEKYEL